MSYVVKNNKNDTYIQFDRFVRDIEIITTAEPVSSILSATEFETAESANELIEAAKSFMDDYELENSDLQVIDKDLSLNLQKEKAEQDEKENQIKAWANTSVNSKKEILQQQYDQGATIESLKEFLDEVKDPDSTSLIDTNPFRNHQHIFDNMEKILGRPLSETEKQQYLENENKI